MAAVAIIPARGGSKRIPGKNIRSFRGAPIITYSIEAARATGLFDRILVSTDCDDVAAVALAAGAEVPFTRPAELSDDYTGVADAAAHALRELPQAPPYACCLYATAPLIRPEDLVRGLEAIRSGGGTVAASVTTFAYPAQRALTLTDAGDLTWLWPEHATSRSNDLPETYHDAAHFFWVHVERFLARPVIFGNHTIPVVISRGLVQDIDTEEDWTVAEQRYDLLHSAQEGP